MISLEKEFFYQVQYGEDEAEIIRRFNTSRENIKRNNNSIPYYQGEWLHIKVNDYETYIVKPMDTIERIAEQYSISVHDLISSNNLQSRRLYIGQLIKIYSREHK